MDSKKQSTQPGKGNPRMLVRQGSGPGWVEQETSSGWNRMIEVMSSRRCNSKMQSLYWEDEGRRSREKEVTGLHPWVPERHVNREHLECKDQELEGRHSTWRFERNCKKERVKA